MFNKVKEIIDEELIRIKEDLLQLCELEGVDIKKEVKLYFKDI